MTGCKCFSENLERIREKVKDQIPADAADLSVEWENAAFFPGGGDYAPVNPRVRIEFREAKRGGGYRKNLTRDSVSMLCNFCPFCGRELGKNKGDGEVRS